LHSLRVVDELDSPYQNHRGLNLTFAVRDGIACHNGEFFEQEVEPARNKTCDQLKKMIKLGAPPATLEGCVARFADKIAYLGRDLEDALDVNIIKESEIPNIIKSRLGLTNRDIIDVLIKDLVDYSSKNKIIGFSTRIFEAVKECKDFNYEQIYSNPKVTQPFRQIKHAMKAMFEEFSDLIANAQKKGDLNIIENYNNSDIYKVLALFLKDDIREWTELKPERITLDFIAGMTDNYFITKFSEIFLPQNTV